MNKRLITSTRAFVLCLSLVAFTGAHAKKEFGFFEKSSEKSTAQMPAAGTLEVAFSPKGGGEALVVKVIDSAQAQLLVLAYSFTSAPITRALVQAVHRGVKVSLVVDYKNNIEQDKSGKARAALSTLATAGADVRTIRVYAIHHDKVILADAQTVQLGSFNYSDAAQRSNSENVIVNWQNPALAKVYTDHFARNYRQAETFKAQY